MDKRITKRMYIGYLDEYGEVASFVTEGDELFVTAIMTRGFVKPISHEGHMGLRHIPPHRVLFVDEFYYGPDATAEA